MERVCAVFGDVHGEAELLRQLIQKVREKYPEAEFYSVGDLIDRGPDSRGVIQICLEEGVSGLMGNHDQWLFNLVVHNQFEPFCLKPIMGGSATIKSFGVKQDAIPRVSEKALAFNLYNAITPEQKDWIQKLLPYRKLEVGDQTYWLIHAGLTNSIANSKAVELAQNDDERMKIISEKLLDSILWLTPDVGKRKAFRRQGEGEDNLYHFQNAVQIFGHIPLPEPIIKEHFIALDTGCGTCEPFTLSAIILPTKEIIQVKKDLSWC